MIDTEITALVERLEGTAHRMGTRRREDYLSSITVAEAVQAAAALRAWAVEREAMRGALILAAPHFQGGHSETGKAIAAALGIPFPIRQTLSALAAGQKRDAPNA